MAGSTATQSFVHASCVVWGGAGVLIRGASGTGKSDLALRLIEAGATLVADDQVVLAQDDGPVLCGAPAALAGLLEVRGLGIFRMKHQDDAPLRLVVDLVAEPEPERLPEPRTADVLGIAVAALRLDPRVPSAVARVNLALRGERAF